MSYSVSATGDAEELAVLLRESFAAQTPDPAPGVAHQVETSLEFVREFLAEQGGRYSASLSGHVQQGESDRSSISVNVSATG